MVTQERLRELFSYDPDTGIFTRVIGRKGVSSGAVAGTKLLNGYIKISIDHRQYLAHRLAWLLVHGDPVPRIIDHINGNKADNRLVNLRPATSEQNAHNSALPAHNRSGHKNVCWHKGMAKWHVQIRFDGKQNSLGFYESINEAAEAARIARSERHKEFARDA